MINSDEDSEEDSVSGEMSVNDSEQCVDEYKSSVVEGEPDQLELEMSDNFYIGCASIVSHTAHLMAASSTSAFSLAHLAKFWAPRMGIMFLDEIETPHHIPAYECYANDRGHLSFQGSVWPSEKDILPKYYQNITYFRNYHRNRRTMIRFIEQKLVDLQSLHKNGQNLYKYIPSGGDAQLIS
ncbi:unnamed protein product [Trichobilharzia szidati]|nr:unnamed protein product [Trichobilharzia szidati]